MNFIFEDVDNLENFTKCVDVNRSGMKRFSTSPIVNNILYRTTDNRIHSSNKRVKNYVISTGVNHHPKEWTGKPVEYLSIDNEDIHFVAVYDPSDLRIIKVGPSISYENETNKIYIDSTLAENLVQGVINIGSLEVDLENLVINQKKTTYDFATRLSIFSYLDKKYLKDLKSGNAMLLIDQSLEGYQTSWLWNYFHTECEKYKINPNSVIFVTGNLLADRQYVEWIEEEKKTATINVIPYTHFEHDVKFMAEQMDLDLKIEDHVRYKKQNFNNIKTYNCLMKRLRAHRCWWYTYLYRNKLLEDGLVSMNAFNRRHTCLDGKFLTHDIVRQSNKILPLEIYGKSNVEHQDNFYIRRIVPEVHLDSWVTVVSEASFSDQENTVFLSEKLFKPIVCRHPFILVGNRGSLKKLREMGYMTFDGFIDESYDDLPTLERFDAIIKAITDVRDIKDKISWYESMTDILEHNYKVLEKNTIQINPSCVKVQQVYNTYFKEDLDA